MQRSDTELHLKKEVGLIIKLFFCVDRELTKYSLVTSLGACYCESHRGCVRDTHDAFVKLHIVLISTQQIKVADFIEVAYRDLLVSRDSLLPNCPIGL